MRGCSFQTRKQVDSPVSYPVSGNSGSQCPASLSWSNVNKNSPQVFSIQPYLSPLCKSFSPPIKQNFIQYNFNFNQWLMFIIALINQSINFRNLLKAKSWLILLPQFLTMEFASPSPDLLAWEDTFINHYLRPFMERMLAFRWIYFLSYKRRNV